MAIHADPDGLRYVSQELQSLVEEMRQQEGRMQVDVDYVSQGWSDQRFQQFEEHWQMMHTYLRRFYSETEKYVDFLEAKAKALEDYLDR